MYIIKLAEKIWAGDIAPTPVFNEVRRMDSKAEANAFLNEIKSNQGSRWPDAEIVKVKE